MNPVTVILVALLLCLGEAKGIDLHNLFRIVGGVAQKISRAKATKCILGKQVERCRFNASALRVDVDDSIELTVKEWGETIICNRKLMKRNSHWYGSCDGDAQDMNLIRQSHPDGGKERLFGSIRVGKEVCRIAPNADGDEEIICKADTEFKDVEPTVDLRTKQISRGNNNATDDTTISGVFGYHPITTATNTTKKNLRGRTNHKADRLLVSTGPTMDIMVVWTKEAECGNSNLPTGCSLTATTESNMYGLIQLAIAETNTAFELSGITSQVRLVHAYRDPDYIEPTTADAFSVALNNLQSATDGYLDSVHAKRILYGADAVHMIIASPTSCGLSFTGFPTRNNMFSASQFSCATGYYSFGHELAHNMNSLHDRGSHKACSSSTTTYNYGYRDPQAAFRSIMAYDCVVGECDNIATNSCPRVQRFSNPNILYNGKVIGSATQNNARVINEMSAIVASFLPAMNCKSDAECNDQDPATYDTCNVAMGICVFSTRNPPLAPSPVPGMPISQPNVVFTNGASNPAPVPAPVAASRLPQQPYMESLVVRAVASTTWKTVRLVGSYKSAVPVCIVQYDTSVGMLPAVGTWKLEDGRKVEARKYLSTVTDRKASWVGQLQKYNNTYTSPVVLGQVLSYNDPKWSVFWCRGSRRTLRPTGSVLYTGKHVGEDATTSRVDEVVGYIVFEAGHATSNGIEIETSRGGDTTLGYVNNSSTYSFGTPFAATPAVVVASQVGMDESDGSWAVLTSSPTTQQMGIAVDEDEIVDAERSHTTEEMDYAVFSTTGTVNIYPSRA